MKRREALLLPLAAMAANQKTTVSIDGERFKINGKLTYPGSKVEGLLMNSRMVQGIFDDDNQETAKRWAYKDTGKWDAGRNTKEFLAAMPIWRKSGLLAFAINIQGGSPEGYSRQQPWETGGIASDGSLKPAYMKRLERILDRADDLGMVVMLGVFYFGQDQRVKDEAAVKRAVGNAAKWVLDHGYRNILFEVNNECNIKAYDHDILKADRVHELISYAKSLGPLLVGTSYGGGFVPLPNVVKVSDFLLIHGNGVKEPARITAMVRETRKVDGYRPMPILFNEDDHFDFDKAENNMMSAIAERASWGYFDPEGYQTPPVNWGIDTDRKKAFFKKLLEVSGFVVVFMLQTSHLFL